MNRRELVTIRKLLGKSQRDLARLLGVSIKAIHSYEQGWRGIPDGVERQVFFLLSMHRNAGSSRVCWEAKECPPERRLRCPAWEFRSGHICWFINGTICQGEALKTWKEKIGLCRRCAVFLPLYRETLNALRDDGAQPEDQPQQDCQ